MLEPEPTACSTKLSEFSVLKKTATGTLNCDGIQTNDRLIKLQTIYLSISRPSESKVCNIIKVFVLVL